MFPRKLTREYECTKFGSRQFNKTLILHEVQIQLYQFSKRKIIYLTKHEYVI